MRRQGLVLLCTLGFAALAAAVAATVARAHSTPQIRAEQSRERQVMTQVNQIGQNLQLVEDEAQKAGQRLLLVKQSLRLNEQKLHLAKANLHAAQKRLMSRLYSLYVNGAPSTIDVLAGAHSISQIIDRAESAQVLSNQDAELGQQAVRYEQTVLQRERQLKRLKQQRENAVAEINAKLRTKRSELAQQRQLLASIHTTIHQLQVQEAARERRLAAEAEARLKAEEAAKARRAAAARAAAAQAQSHTTSSSSASSPPSVPAPPPPPPNIPTGGGTGAGHPQAASIALQYLGVPYVYGGSSPSGFDCSGLVMYVYGRLGISLPHYTVAQWNATEPVSSPQPGDLVFFNGLGHVGIYIGNGQFVDAPHTGSVVRIDSISGFGSYDGARRVP